MQIMIHITFLNECAKILAKWETAKRGKRVKDMLVQGSRSMKIDMCKQHCEIRYNKCASNLASYRLIKPYSPLRKN